MYNESMTNEQFIMKVLAISKIGLKFSRDPYALENYAELQELGLQQLSQLTNESIAENIFDRDLYPTVNVSARTVVTNEKNQVLMVKEKSEQLWSFPGGWCDVYESPQENALKEVLQESGYLIKMNRLLGVFFRDNYKPKHKSLISEYCIYFHGEIIEKVSEHNHEIVEVGFFDQDNLPPLSFKNSKTEVERALKALNHNITTFD